METNLNVIHQSRVVTKTDTGRSYNISYSGTESEIDDFIKTLKIGSYYGEFQGYLTDVEKSQIAGQQWRLDLEFRVEFSSGGGGEEPEEPENQEPVWSQHKTASLSVRNLQLPLERLDNYKMNWDHFLVHRNFASLPAWWETAKTETIPSADAKNFKWIKSRSEMPESTKEDIWEIQKKPTKLGIEFYDFAVFVVTQSVRFRSQQDAGRAVKRTINTITPPENTFGLTGGNWKHDESNVSWDGEFWLATNVYTFSGDEKGWDTDIYGGF